MYKIIEKKKRNRKPSLRDTKEERIHSFYMYYLLVVLKSKEYEP